MVQNIRNPVINIVRRIMYTLYMMLNVEDTEELITDLQSVKLQSLLVAIINEPELFDAIKKEALINSELHLKALCATSSVIHPDLVEYMEIEYRYKDYVDEFQESLNGNFFLFIHSIALSFFIWF